MSDPDMSDDCPNLMGKDDRRSHKQLIVFFHIMYCSQEDKRVVAISALRQFAPSGSTNHPSSWNRLTTEDCAK